MGWLKVADEPNNDGLASGLNRISEESLEKG